jgi:hypothetical protein
VRDGQQNDETRHGHWKGLNASTNLLFLLEKLAGVAGFEPTYGGIKTRSEG